MLVYGANEQVLIGIPLYNYQICNVKKCACKA